MTIEIRYLKGTVVKYGKKFWENCSYVKPPAFIEVLEFEDIKNHFDKLNEDESHFVNSNDICTPMDCVKEMIDSIVVDVLINILRKI